MISSEKNKRTNYKYLRIRTRVILKRSSESSENEVGEKSSFNENAIAAAVAAQVKMRSYALKELTERPAHMCNHEHRLSSSFKDEDETNFQPQQQQQQQQVYMAATRPTTTATRNIFKMFKITKKAQVSGTSANSSFGDDDSVDVASSSSSTRQPTFIVKSKSTDKLSSKFLNMILAARHSSTSSVSRHKSTSAEDCKILLPKYHKFKPFQVNKWTLENEYILWFRKLSF